jgi:hypothetical protein
MFCIVSLMQSLTDLFGLAGRCMMAHRMASLFDSICFLCVAFYRFFYEFFGSLDSIVCFLQDVNTGPSYVIVVQVRRAEVDMAKFRADAQAAEQASRDFERRTRGVNLKDLQWHEQALCSSL